MGQVVRKGVDEGREWGREWETEMGKGSPGETEETKEIQYKHKRTENKNNSNIGNQ